MVLSEGVRSTSSPSGALAVEDLRLEDVGGDNPRTIASVSHQVWDDVAIVTLSGPSYAGDMGIDTLAASARGAFVDEFDRPCELRAVRLAPLACPLGDYGHGGVTRFELDEPAGSATAGDAGGVVAGDAEGGDVFRGDGTFHGDGRDNVIHFADSPDCLAATASLLLAARLRPRRVDDGDGVTIQRVFLKDGTNYQLSLWRNTTGDWSPSYAPPAGVSSFAFWLRPLDPGGGRPWKLVLTDYDACPIVADHWYRVTLVWDSSRAGGMPGTFYVEDQGLDGQGKAALWAGDQDCTDADQSQIPTDRWLREGDRILSGSGPLHIGGTGKGTLLFEGQIDWIEVSTDPSTVRSVAAGHRQ